MDEFTKGNPQYTLKTSVPTNGNPQITDEALTPGWQPHRHAPNQQNGNHNGNGQKADIAPFDKDFDLSALHLQKQALPHRPCVSFSHPEMDHMKKETARLIAEERRQLDEAEQILAMPGFLKAFDLFLRATQRK